MNTDILNAESVIKARRAVAPARDRGPAIDPARRAQRDTVRGSVGNAALLKALDATRSSVFFLSTSLQIVDANDAACRFSGYRRDELREMRFDEVLVDEGDTPLRAGLERLLRGEAASETLPARQRIKNGGSLSVQIQLHFVDQATDSLLVAVVEDADEDELDEWTRNDASRDYLTALPERAALEARLRRAESRARQRRSRFAILFIDVDRFKNINDTHGHRVGDLVLQTLSRRLLSSVRPDDFVARYGGDEFVALIEDVHGKAEVEQIAARIRADLTAPVHAPGGQVQISVSVGIAIGHAASSAQVLVDEADRAMYRVKEAKLATDIGPSQRAAVKQRSRSFKSRP